MTQVKIATTADISADKAFKAKANDQTLIVAKVGDKYCAIAINAGSGERKPGVMASTVSGENRCY